MEIGQDIPQMQAAQSEPIFDVVIAGASHSGLAAALALSRALGDDLRVALIDRKRPTQTPGTPDVRAFALSAGSRRLLEAISVWPKLAALAQPVERIDITDSALDDAIRPVLLSYDNHVGAAEPAMFIVLAEALRNALAEAVGASPGIRILAPAEIVACETRTDSVHLVLRGALAERTEIRTRLLIAADGRASPVREMLGLQNLTWQTEQTGIVTTVHHERPHDGCAVQHFLPAGPFAILPLPGNSSCITWTEASETARAILGLPDDLFLAEVERRFGFKLGAVSLASPRAAWPLEFQIARRLIAPRVALIGDAARTVHPIAGQGFNLGLRDVAALTEVVAEGMRLGLDPGDATGLERYERWRRFDSTMSSAAFGALNAMFSNESVVLRGVRDAGLGVVDRLDGLKQLLVTEAAGLTGEVPRLLKGEPV